MIAPPRILFVADAGAQVGGGHVMRCLTLAEALCRARARCGFVVTPAAAGVLDVFAGADIERLHVRAGQSPAAAAARLARAWPADAVVVDHYGIGQDEEAALAAVAPLVAMDDLRRPHAAGLVIDSNLGRTSADYPGLDALTGPAFALVRPAFAALRPACLTRRAKSVAVERILVCLGLTDLGGITGRVVRTLAPLLGERQVDVVIGAAAPSLPDLQAIARQDPRLVLHVDTKDMAGLTARADLAVGAGGSSTWERCALGLPSLTLVLADNQRDNARALTDAGASELVEASALDFETMLAECVRGLLDDGALRGRLSRASAALCDGRGADRAAARVLKLVR